MLLLPLTACTNSEKNARGFYEGHFGLQETEVEEARDIYEDYGEIRPLNEEVELIGTTFLSDAHAFFLLFIPSLKVMNSFPG